MTYGGAIGFRNNNWMDLENINEHRAYEQKCRLCHLSLSGIRGPGKSVFGIVFMAVRVGNATCAFHV
jgi:hypothetical protein